MTAPTTTFTQQLPGYTAGTWTIDPVHSEVSFTARHMMVTKVRGLFEKFEGELVLGETPLESSVTATIDVASVNTRNEQRDNHIRSADFLEAEKHPTMTYRSTGVRPDGDDFIVDGELTLHGVTRQVPLSLELNGFTPDPYGGTRVGFSASAEINRQDFDVTIKMPMDGGGVVVGDKVQINLEIQAVLNN